MASRKPPKHKPAPDPHRRQAAIGEIVAILVAPGFGVDLDQASAIARGVVRDHPERALVDLIPLVVARLERVLTDAA